MEFPSYVRRVASNSVADFPSLRKKWREGTGWISQFFRAESGHAPSTAAAVRTPTQAQFASWEFMRRRPRPQSGILRISSTPQVVRYGGTDASFAEANGDSHKEFYREGTLCCAGENRRGVSRSLV